MFQNQCLTAGGNESIVYTTNISNNNRQIKIKIFYCKQLLMNMTTLYWGYISFYDKQTRKKFMYGMRQQPHYTSILCFKIGSLSPCHHHKRDGPLARWFHMVYPRHKAHILMSSSYPIFTKVKPIYGPKSYHFTHKQTI